MTDIRWHWQPSEDRAAKAAPFTLHERCASRSASASLTDVNPVAIRVGKNESPLAVILVFQ